MKKRLLTVVASGLLCTALLTGCGSSDSSESSDRGGMMNAAPAAESKAASYDYDSMALEEPEYENYEEAGDYSYDDDVSGGLSSDTQVNESSISPNDSRKLIRTLNMTAETLAYDDLIRSVKNRVSQLGGYFESLNENKNSYGSQTRYASMTIKVPRDKADELVSVMEEESNIISREDNTKDVTLDYVDMQSHKESLKTEQKRLMELMERAETVEDIITLESRLSQVRYEIESMESQLRTYDNKIDYTTIYLNINEVEEITPTEEPGYWEKIGQGLKDSFEGMITGFTDIFAWFIVNLPYLLLIFIIVFAVIKLVIKPMMKKAEAAREKRKKEYEEFMRNRPMGMMMPPPGAVPPGPGRGPQMPGPGMPPAQAVPGGAAGNGQDPAPTEGANPWAGAPVETEKL